ncbi:3565_t:CDS:2 [Cetraspora pellucida]|uniref:3565_t:CDS:1 n=1 Tax=Cetraspora pellucida TaxID=1433469 RepID=A0ACA9K3F1_9GLOM|nr:3565_t:CDS:2 [Cetraspora pellucida]
MPKWQDIAKAIKEIVIVADYCGKPRDGKLMKAYKKQYRNLFNAEEPDEYILAKPHFKDLTKIRSEIDYLNTISEAGNLLEQSTIDTYLHLNNRINNAVNQITNLQIQLGTLQNDYDLLNQAYRAHKLNYHLLKATSIDKKNLPIILSNTIPTENQSQYKKALDHLDFIAQRLGYPDDASRDPDALDNFIEKELYNRLGYMNFNIQTKKLYTTKKPTKAKKKTVTRYCSMCEKAGHTKTNCPKVCRARHSVSKKAKQINNISQYGYISQSQSEDEIEYDQEETSQSESDQENSEIESQETNCFNLKKKVGYIRQCPKEVLTEIYTDLSKLFPEMKDSYYSYHLKNYTKKEVDKVWENIIKKYQVILEPLFQACSSSSHELKKVEGSSSLNYAIKQYQEAQLYRNWLDPLKINFLQIKEPNNYATISCKVYDLEIPHALLDTGSDGSHISENIANHIIKYFGLKLDRKKIYRLTGAVGEKQSIGSFSDIPVTIGIKNDTLTISDEFSVLPTEKDNNGNDISLFILGTRWQHRAGWEPIVKGEFTASANGKTIIIPLSVYNKNEEAKLQISNSLKKK